MVTLYFNNAVNQAWDTLGNWWTDAGCTSAAAAIPATGDTVIVVADATLGSAPSVLIQPASVQFVATEGTGAALNSANLTAFSCAIEFNSGSYNDGTVTTGTFNDNSINGGTVTTGTFNGSSNNNYGSVTTGTFNDSSYNSSGTVTTGTFNDSSSNNSGTVTTAIVRQRISAFLAWRDYCSSSYVGTLELKFPELDVIGGGLT
jgi:hypothetical protein